MKIIFYSPHPTHDIVTEVGYATHQRETINALKDLGVDVIPEILGGSTWAEVPFKEGKAVEPKGLKGILKKIIPRFIWVSLRDFDLFAKHDLKARIRLEKSVSLHKPDLIYERSEYLQDSGMRVAKKFGIKHFIEVNAPFVEEMKKMEGLSAWHWLAHKKEKKKYASADKIFVVSTVLKEFLIKRYNVNEDKILVSPNRINKESFLKAVESAPVINFRDKYPVVGFVGSILPHHGVPLLLKVFDFLNAQNIEANLLIVGGGGMLEELIQITADKGLKDRIHFTGKIPHSLVPGYIQCMDICIMPDSNWYGSPVKIFEYGILGKAIIAPDNGPVRDVMVDGEDGLLVKNTIEDIANAIKRLLNDNRLCRQLGENFKKKIEANYTWENAAKMIIEQSKS
ncbi:MAG: glycosyltransferase family 4 protein [Bacteroidetes bacterium]|nr:glycosyltransferase family 4 protein [Bacteroidota bacterium]